MLLCWILVNVTCVIVILDTVWMLFLFFWTLNKNKFPKNLDTFKINYFLPKLLESYNMYMMEQIITLHVTKNGTKIHKENSSQTQKFQSDRPIEFACGMLWDDIIWQATTSFKFEVDFVRKFGGRVRCFVWTTPCTSYANLNLCELLKIKVWLFWVWMDITIRN